VGFHVGPNSITSAAIAKTLRSVFTTVRCVRDGDPTEDVEIPYNIICFASPRDTITFAIPDGADKAESETILWLYTKLDSWIVLSTAELENRDVPLLTAQDNILASSPPPIHQLLRQQIQGYIPEWIWKRTSSSTAE
jgi:hypothetical protein